MREATGGGGSSQGGLFTPPPGDPGAIRAAANQLKSHGTSVGDLAASARRTSTNLIATGDWEGPASDKYSTFSGNLIGLASDAEEPAGTIAGGANQYADALDTLKRKLTDAASRHQTASARAENIRTTTNSNPNRTPAQVQAAQDEVNKLDDEAKAAEADARRAWAEYNHESEAAAKAIAQAGKTVEEGSSESTVGELLASESEAESGFIPEWLVELHEKADPLLIALEQVANKGFEGVLGNRSLLTKTMDGIGSQIDGWKSELSGLFEEIGPDGVPTEEQANLISALKNRIDAADAFLGDDSKTLSGIMDQVGMLGKVKLGMGALAIPFDINTMLHPTDSGAAGVVQSVMSGANALGSGAGLVGTLGDMGVIGGLNASCDWVPGVGEAVALGSGIYLAGDYLYHHWPHFKDAVNDTAGTVVNFEKAELEPFKGVYHVEGDLLHGAGRGLSDLGHGAVNAGSDLLHGNLSGAAGDITSMGSHLLSDTSSTMSSVGNDTLDAVNNTVNDLGNAAHDAGKVVGDVGKMGGDVTHAVGSGVSKVVGWFS